MPIGKAIGNPSMISLLVFDLDGTLIDSREDITASVNHVLITLRLNPLSSGTITAFVGRGVSNLIRSVLGEAHRELFKEAMKLFRGHYSKHLVDKTTLYPDVKPLLEAIYGISKVVITNKPTDYAIQIMKGLQIDQHFAEVLGGDTVEAKKPSPGILLNLVRRFRVGLDETMIVGDSTIDIETGKNAGVQTCAVTYGFGRREDLVQASPDYLLDRLKDLKAIVHSGRYPRLDAPST